MALTEEIGFVYWDGLGDKRTAKFGDALRSKTRRAQINEALCKILCHNICVVIQSIYELGIDPTFWPE
jgi:hypothetical protein